MDKMAIAMLNHEQDRLRGNIASSKNKLEQIKRFMIDYPNVNINSANCFLAWVNLGCYSYEGILERMGGPLE